MAAGGVSKILACGGREYRDYRRLSSVLDNLCHERGWIVGSPDGLWMPNVTVISGMARGADTLAVDWATDNFCPTLKFYADWDTHGKAAGPIRNQQMIDEGKPDLVVAFPGGRGTADMVRRSRKAGIEVVEILA
ncbi:DUF2493 domain-containing protein [Manganibacter manganicus]|uniref:YspA cpYpsA-related SLOG domain-containing protein n=1 Tax=Manganibacter manganicus TaxID=1873176 RepID=A0A1V8RNY1_9HYPH|nr:DUF2493 domain-containing protein [Pseudaminobacter manganicus]OQM74911.1 hypothetical protein BFN67_04665 [Pseudaminobacter manganicus]